MEYRQSGLCSQVIYFGAQNFVHGGAEFKNKAHFMPPRLYDSTFLWNHCRSEVKNDQSEVKNDQG